MPQPPDVSSPARAGAALAARRVWWDGALVPWAEARVHLFAQSLQRGTLAFDVMSCHRVGRTVAVLGLTPHLERFLRSCELAGLALDADLEALRRAVAETVAANPGAELVKVCAFHAEPTFDLLPPVGARPSLAVAAVSLADLGVRAARPPRPARLALARLRKPPAEVFPPEAKLAAAYAAGAAERARARREGFDDVLFLDLEGRIAEAPTQSFFAVREGRLRTAELGRVLPGVTRRLLLELARAEGLPVEERAIELGELDAIAEAFTAGTSVEIWPVAAIGERALRSPVPGAVTRALAARLGRLLRGEDPLAARWLEPVAEEPGAAAVRGRAGP